jgi:hypothetical protein
MTVIWTGRPSDDAIRVFMYFSALDRYDVLLTTTSLERARRWVLHLQQQGKHAYYEASCVTVARPKGAG